MNRYLLYIWTIMVLLAACRHAAPIAVGCVEVEVANSCYAGQELTLEIKSRKGSRGNGYLLIDNSRGVELLCINMEKDTIVKRQFFASGIVKIQSFVNSKLCSSKQIFVKPLPPVRPLPAYLGPKSIKTGSQISTMMTVIPLDQFGNLLPDTTMINFSVIHPNGTIEKKTDSLYGGIASLYINTSLVSGKGFAMATIGAVPSRETDFLEISADPVDFKINASVHSSYADGRQTFKMMTDKLSDPYGNVLPEGSIVYFNCYDSQGTVRVITGYTIGGVATVYLQNPARPGLLKVNAHTISGAGSNTVALVFSTPKFEY